MLNTIKISIMVLACLIFLPKLSYAWDAQHGRDDGRTHHGHSFRSHVNPDLTLITGMDDIDRRVLIASDPGQSPEVTDQALPEVAMAAPAQIVGSNTYGNFIVNVPNNAGGYTPIRIQKSGNGYVGPQGEFYYPFPQISQLKAMYGI